MAFQANFDISLWNVHDRVLRQQPLTTNDLEAFHTKINVSFKNRKHTNMNEFFRLLVEFQQECTIDSANKSITKRPRKHTYEKHAKNLLTQCSQYQVNFKENRRLRHAVEGFVDPEGSNRKDFLLLISHMCRYYRDGKVHTADSDEEKVERKGTGKGKPVSSNKSGADILKEKIEAMRANAKQIELSSDEEEQEEKEEEPKMDLPKRGRGRPKGSKNKPKASVDLLSKRLRDRQVKKASLPIDSSSDESTIPKASKVAKRGRGRPRKQ